MGRAGSLPFTVFFSFSSCQLLLQTLWETFPFPELLSSPREFPCAKGIFGVFLLQGWVWEAKAVPDPAGQLFRSPGCCSDTSFIKREVFAQSVQHSCCAPPMSSRCKAILQLGASSPGRKSSFRPSVSITETEITVQGRNVVSFLAVLWLSGSLQEAGSQVWGREAEKHQGCSILPSCCTAAPALWHAGKHHFGNTILQNRALFGQNSKLHR